MQAATVALARQEEQIAYRSKHRPEDCKSMSDDYAVVLSVVKVFFEKHGSLIDYTERLGPEIISTLWNW